MDINQQERESLNQLEKLVRANLEKQQTLAALQRFTKYLEQIEITHLDQDDTAAGTRIAVSQIGAMVNELNQRVLQVDVTEKEYDEQIEPWIVRYRKAVQRFNRMTGKIIAGLEQFETMEKNNGSNSVN